MPELAEDNVSYVPEQEVKSYQKVASLGGWAGGGRTLWAIAAVGLIAGAAIGIVAPFFPALMGVTGASFALAMDVVPKSMAVFGTMGMGMGFSGGLVLGRISGAAAAVGEEQERRMKSWTAAQLKQIDGKYVPVPEPELDTKEPVKTTQQKLTDSYYEYVNPKIGIIMAGVGAAGGLVLSAASYATGGVVGGILPEGLTIAAMTGAPATAAATTAYLTGITAAFGSLWALNFPKITSNVTEFTGQLVGGNIIGREWKPKSEISPEHQLQQNFAEYTMYNDQEYGLPAVTYQSKMQPVKSHQEMVENSQLNIAEQHTR